MHCVKKHGHVTISVCVPGMRILVMLLLDTLPMLGNVLLLCFFVFFIFGIVGVQLWEGILRQRCYLKQLPNISYPRWALYLTMWCFVCVLSVVVWFDQLISHSFNPSGRKFPQLKSVLYHKWLVCTQIFNNNNL